MSPSITEYDNNDAAFLMKMKRHNEKYRRHVTGCRRARMSRRSTRRRKESHIEERMPRSEVDGEKKSRE
jgi:hypothetical protein